MYIIYIHTHTHPVSMPTYFSLSLSLSLSSLSLSSLSLSLFPSPLSPSRRRSQRDHGHSSCCPNQTAACACQRPGLAGSRQSRDMREPRSAACHPFCRWWWWWWWWWCGTNRNPVRIEGGQKGVQGRGSARSSMKAKVCRISHLCFTLPALCRDSAFSACCCCCCFCRCACSISPCLKYPLLREQKTP